MTEKTVTRTVYVAYDGSEFDDAAECERHESRETVRSEYVTTLRKISVLKGRGSSCGAFSQVDEAVKLRKSRLMAGISRISPSSLADAADAYNAYRGAVLALHGYRRTYAELKRRLDELGARLGYRKPSRKASKTRCCHSSGGRETK